MIDRRWGLGRGIYIHVPFCLSKCRYCAFNSHPSPWGVPDAYVGALLADLKDEARAWTGVSFGSVYMGGGTPALLSPDQLRILMDGLHRHYRISPAAETTMECNPGCLNLEKLEAFRGAGVNRLSVGIQSMCDSELALLGRSHQASEAQEALRLARSAGFENLNADLLIGIPGQTLASLAETLDRVVDQVRHLSLYLLSVEPGTVLEGMVNSGQVEIPSEEQVISLWEWASARLVESGLKRYEISNWSQPGYESVHNMVYWQRGEYAGIGAGAHSHREGRRYSKIGSIPEYLAAVNGGLDPLGMHEVLTGQQMFLEELMLGLRMVAGVDLARLVERFDVDREGLQQCLDVLAERGLVIRNSNYLLLSPTGLALHDAVSEAIAYAAHAL